MAFPLISSGIYGWPKQDAVRQAVTAVRAADTRVETVIFVGYNAATTALLRAAVE